MDAFFDRLQQMFFSGQALLLSPFYLSGFVVIAFVIYLMRREQGGFFRWLFPARVYGHRSTRADVGLFALGQLSLALGLLARFAAAPAVAAYVAARMPYAPLGDIQLSPVGLALLLFMAGDFALYWAHRAHHTIAVIWPLHAVHHSAEVLSPITAYRQHPLSSAINTSFNTVVVGALFGLLVGVFDPNATVIEIAGANAFVVIVNMTVTNFHHSHIWVSFGPVWERLVISPAQHQVHHSTDPAHFNKNFGQTLAIWDWMFGSLYLTGKDESVTFGLNSKADAPLMTHRLWQVLWDPLRRIAYLAIGRRDV